MSSDDPTAPVLAGESAAPSDDSIVDHGRDVSSEPADGAGPHPDDDLLSQLEIVESQPLADRAAAYEAIHEDLARRLESNTTAPGR